jgi:hypothetical protein
MEHVAAFYIYIYINAAANSAMLHLYLQNDFYSVIFKIKHKLRVASGPAPRLKILGAHLSIAVLPRKEYTAPTV